MRRFVTILALTVAGMWAQGVPQKGPAKDLNDLLDKAGQTSARGDKVSAIKMLESALIMTQKDPALKGRDLDVLRAMGHVYADAKQYPNSIRAYQTMLDEMKAGCVAGKPKAELCADVYYDLGTAQMYAGDWAGAVITLRQAVPLYDAMIKSGTAPDYRLAKIKLEANTRSMLGAAQFRSGDLTGAIATYEKAVQQYSTVANSPESGDGLRMLARQSLAQEQQSLNMLKAEAAKLAAEKKAAPPKK
jgi:tetratricopeptide (TPR) repeat protein